MTAMPEYATLALSLSGRDKDQLLAVVREDDRGVWLADGKRRPLERPKCKNPRHIRLLPDSISREAMTTNRALRRALNAYREEHGV